MIDRCTHTIVSYPYRGDYGMFQTLTSSPWADVVNGSFEFLAGFMICLHIVKVLKDKNVAGVSTIATAYFAAWGYWNLYYYPSLDQWVSFAGGIFVVTANTIWVILLLYFGWWNKR